MPSASPDKDLSEDLVPLLVKELKVAHGKIYQLGLDLDMASWTADGCKQRAEKAEQAMKVLQQNFEKVSEENCRLRLRTRMAVKADSVTIKMEDKEADDALRIGGHPSTNSAREPGMNRCACYSKYEDEKNNREQSEKACRALQQELEEIKSANKQRQAQMDVVSMVVNKSNPQMKTLNDICQKVSDILIHLSHLPACPGKPNIDDLAPVCHDGVDLKEYLQADPRSSKYANNALYLPGLCMPRKHHFLVVSPLHTYDTSNETWHKNDKCANIIGWTMSFFIRQKDLIYYTGEYLVKDLHAERPSRVASVDECTINWDKLADATMDTEAGEKKNIANMNRGIIKRLYRASILTVVPLGLQCVGFNQSLYDQLKVRFEVSLPKSKRKELLEVESDKQSKKRQRVEGTSN